MILTCPSCTMRYIVSEGAIGPNGRKVRCAHCGHEWRQEPEEGLDEVLFEKEEKMEADLSFMSGMMEEQEKEAASDKHPEPPPEPETQAKAGAATDFGSILEQEMRDEVDIPEGLKPRPEDEQPVESSATKKRAASGGTKAGFLAAGLVYLVLFVAFLLLQPQISRIWPPSNMVYGWFGLTPAAPGEGLALDGLSAKIAGGQILMSGNIINLKGEEMAIPAVMAMIVDETDTVLEKVLIVPPAETVAAEDQVSFDVVYPSVPDGATNVNFAFSFVKPKPAADDITAETEHDDDRPEESSEPESPHSEEH